MLSGAADKLIKTMQSRKFDGILPQTQEQQEAAEREKEAEERAEQARAQALLAAARPPPLLLDNEIKSDARPGAVGQNRTPHGGGTSNGELLTMGSPSGSPLLGGNMFVELAVLSSGRIFGEGVARDQGKKRTFSAVADTNVEVLVIRRADVEVCVLCGWVGGVVCHLECW
jgi:hypothetical protein